MVCLIDDNPAKRNRILEGIRIVGDSDDIREMAERYHIDKIIYAIPSSDSATRKRILTICNETSCEVQVVPGVYELATAAGHHDDLAGNIPVNLIQIDLNRITAEKILNLHEQMKKIIAISGNDWDGGVLK